MTVIAPKPKPHCINKLSGSSSRGPDHGERCRRWGKIQVRGEFANDTFDDDSLPFGVARERENPPIIIASLSFALLHKTKVCRKHISCTACHFAFPDIDLKT